MVAAAIFKLLPVPISVTWPLFSGVTMKWLLRLVTDPNRVKGMRGPRPEKVPGGPEWLRYTIGFFRLQRLVFTPYFACVQQPVAELLR